MSSSTQNQQAFMPKTSCVLVSEPERKKMKEALVTIDKIWKSISMGASSVPRGTMNLVRIRLGEGGEQFYQDVVEPLFRPGGPDSVLQEHFWYCWLEFLSDSILHKDNATFDTADNPTYMIDDEDPSVHGGGSVHGEDSSVHGGGSVYGEVPKERIPLPEMQGKMQGMMQIFNEQETLIQILVSSWFSDRRIESRFVQVPQTILEKEFLKVAGNLNESLQGEDIRQYLKYTLVDHPYAISLHNCREFSSLFNKKFKPSTKIMYPDVVKLLRDRRIKGPNQDALIIETALNPNSIHMRAWTFLLRLVGFCYHFHSFSHIASI